ncbi:hypothetical protein [Sphingorhabdus sp. Alg239-R122]|uniref:DUF6975 family protein n=1 Tax=Sphingorhabdus sp. Alg239-R122 TaxID=2305989 RepID=UPI0013DA1946|nr:hypothetical protein [Sphingorhabdus sp. Alg239-R122]
MRDPNQKIAMSKSGGTAKLESCIRSDGSAAHPYADSLLAAPHIANAADSADVSHFFCLLHGHLPSVFDHALGHSADPDMRTWLIKAADDFAQERAFLTKLTVAAGPIASTAGQDQCNALVLEASNALAMLAQSEREGCAFGAAIALASDWHIIRRIMDNIALKVSTESPPLQLSEQGTNFALLSKLAGDKAIYRAIHFGMTQMLAQHRAIWDLMGSRRDCRNSADS